MSLTKYSRAIQDRSGNVIPTVTITVTVSSTGDAASLYTDAAGQFPISGNVVQSNTAGVFEFYVEAGIYDLAMTKNGASIGTDVEVTIAGLAGDDFFIQAGANVVARSIEDKLRDSVSIFEFMSAAQRADVMAETLQMDVSTAFVRAHTDLGNGDTLELPAKLMALSAGITFTKKISIVGKPGAKAYATLCGIGLASDTPILTYAGSTGSRIQDIALKHLRFYSNNNLARALQLTWVNKSNFEDLYFYNLYRGMTGDNAWRNSWKNLSVFGITEDTILFGDECNANHFDACEFRGRYGLRIIGNTAGLHVDCCDFEGITESAGAGIMLAPTTGNQISGVTISGGTYFENIKGACIETAGADADSVRALSVHGCYFFPGSAAFFSSAAGSAEYAVVLDNTTGFEFRCNDFKDIRTAAFFNADNTAVNKGTVENNVGVDCPALSNTGNVFGPSVRVANNFKGPREEWSDTIPTTGSYTSGDKVHKTSYAVDGNNMVKEGWLRITTGSSHGAGVDWVESQISTVSPAA